MNIQCPACHRAYDVAGRPAGTAVTCHCGETFGFPRPAQAPLSVQCAGCGAGTDPGSARCQYCATPLRTLCCPNCFTLMVAGDRHCSQCGISVAAPALYLHRSGTTALPCPRCTTALTANLVDSQIFDRCDRCGGIWAHHLAIDAVLDRKDDRRAVRRWLAALPVPSEAPGTSEFLACPDCEEPMQAHQLPKNKRVTIEVCGDHGIWFDHREIRTLVGSPAQRKRSGRIKSSRVKNRSSFAAFLRDADDWWPWEALEELLDILEDLFD